MGGEVLSTHTTCWRQGRHIPDPSSALGCKTPASFLGNKQSSPVTQARLQETQHVEIPEGKPLAEAPREASLHPAPRSLPY